MTNLEALKAKVGYPLKDNALKLALIDRNLIESETYSTTNKKAFELAYADCLMTVISSPNVSEGGYQVSLSEKASIKAIASGVYQKYGIADHSAPTAKFISIG